MFACRLHRILTSSLVGILVAALAAAAPIPPDALFFAPLSIVDDIYPVQPLSGDGEIDPMTAVWTPADIATLDPGRYDIHIVACQILPVLIANPSAGSQEGEYTDADLSAINVSNYMTYYAQHPGVDVNDTATDYAADLTDDVLTVQFAAPATYQVRVMTTSAASPGGPAEARSYIYTEFAGDDLGRDGARDATGVHRRANPTAQQKDHYVVSEADPNDNPAGTPPGTPGFCAYANSVLGKNGKKVVGAQTIQAAINSINAQCQEFGRPITVTLLGHGRPGSIKLGTERINNQADGNMTPADFGRAVRGCVTALTFFSCNTSQGAVGQQFLIDMANAANVPVTGWPHTVTAARNGAYRGRVIPGYFDIDARTRARAQQPQPTEVQTTTWGKLKMIYR